MSFFGFDTKLPRDRDQPGKGPGFFAPPDPFAEISRNKTAGNDDDDDVIDFEDTYDGLGEQLDEGDDALNDDTFGTELPGPAKAARNVGKDYDFFGQTAKVSSAINEEQLRFNRQQPPPKTIARATSPPRQPPKPFRTGYEVYQRPGYVPDLQVDASIWGTGPSKPAPRLQALQDPSTVTQKPESTIAPAKKMMSLEEVEASMRAKPKGSSPAPARHQQPQGPTARPAQNEQAPHQPSQSQPAYMRQQRPFAAQEPHMLQGSQPIDQHYQAKLPEQPSQASEPAVAQHGSVPQLLQRERSPQYLERSVQQSPMQPRQILQNPHRQQAQFAVRSPELPIPTHSHGRLPSVGGTNPNMARTIITNSQQIIDLSEEQRTAYLIEDAKRAKRNHKIYLLSRDNGLMTPQDKNFITRIQLQQLMTATGNVGDQAGDAALSEDFYYQVHNQIRGGPRQNPHQPLMHFAQPYLFQPGSRQGGMRRQTRGHTHMQRMEQQVQRAVEAAKMKPKSKQLIIEGSLGKISFSNAKTPKPLLNIKRPENGETNRPQSAGRKKSRQDVPAKKLSSSDRKTILKNIEDVYLTLMDMEDQERRMPPPLADDGDEALVNLHLVWRETLQRLNNKLWTNLKVMEPIVPDSSSLHPFIAFLSYSKGKKAIPRIFRHIDQEQRLTILTMIVVHLEHLDVIRLAQTQQSEPQASAQFREEIELFSQAVEPALFGYVNEAPLPIIIGLMGLILDRTNLQVIVRSKAGLGILTMLLSRAELAKEVEEVDGQEWEQWLGLYNRLFDVVEPVLTEIFPSSVNTGQDVHVWQFLAAMGVGASPEQQQRLVLAVKDRVNETVMQSKTLPPDMASQRLATVNLFMRAIGLDVELLG